MRDVALLAALLVPLLGLLALVPPVYQRGEAREALVVHSLLAGGDWIAPRREGILASKPPLFHWIAAGAASLGAESDFALRLPSALAAWTMLVAIFVLGATLFDRRRARLAILALTSTVGFWQPAFDGRVDMVFAATITTAVAGYAYWERTGRPSGLRVLYLGAAAATLTKGPAGFLLPVGIAAAALLWQRGLAGLRALWEPTGMLIAAGIVLGWYGLAIGRAGREFVTVQIVHENLARAVGVGDFARQRRVHPLRMLGTFATLLLPWNLTLLAAWRRGRTPVVLHAWWIVILAFFTIAAGKRDVYLLPLYPAIALIAAEWLAPRIEGRRWALPGLAVLATGMCLTTIVVRRVEAAASPLRPFADAVARALPTTAGVGIRGNVSENDRLVLAYRLRRSVPRLGPTGVTPDYEIVPADAATMQSGCTRAVGWPAPGGGGLVLMSCARE